MKIKIKQKSCINQANKSALAYVYEQQTWLSKLQKVVLSPVARARRPARERR